MKVREVRHECGATVFGISADGRRALSAVDFDYPTRRFLIVVDLERPRVWEKFEAHSTPTTGIALTADGRFAASTANDGVLILWDMDTGEQVARFDGESGLTVQLVSADGTSIVARDSRGQVHILRLVRPWDA
jgi:WD40 repeat protein